MHSWYDAHMTERITITLPDGLVADLDEIAAARGLSRSGVIREASARYVAEADEAEAAARRTAAAGALLDYLDELRSQPVLDNRPLAEVLRDARGLPSPEPDRRKGPL
jgi:predicted transcriptional regulator